MIGDIHHRKFAIISIAEINFCEGNDSVGDPNKLHDAQMLFGLWLPTLVAVYHQDAGVDSPDAGQHIADEFGVTRHVNECDVFAGW